MNFSHKIASELNTQEKHVIEIIKLLEGGATIPFISRYRKEWTGSANEVVVQNVENRLQQLKDIEKRREAILKSIKEQEKLTPDVERKIKHAETLTQLEDIYLPYKPKRKTKASIAREKGLEPLSILILKQNSNDVASEALKYIDNEKDVKSIEEALQGARDIIAEIINEDTLSRERLRNLFWKNGIISSKIIKSKQETAQKYKDYFEWSEAISKIPSHRLLAMRRGEKETFLSLNILPEEEKALSIIENIFLKGNNEASKQVEIAIKDSYKRLLKPSMETETRLKSKLIADEEAINVFADNIRELLLSAPLGQKAVLAIDPGFRTGCKVVCLGKQGKLLENVAIYPTQPKNQTAEATKIIQKLVSKYKIEAIAIGNGTASRETEIFINSIPFEKKPLVVIVNESGASIYSASEVAREEFPNEDITVRGSVSIGRRLMDPLAELVKLDPKSIGVGQYQHDVDQSLLKKALDTVVNSSVNKIGVEINTASKELLSYVSGVGPVLAKNIVAYRNENGAFSSRNELKKVPRLGDKVYEQAVGFIRIRNAKNPLDESAVHPERYKLVTQMAKDLGCQVKELIKNAPNTKRINLQKYISKDVGLPTLKDIILELEKPGRDPREQFEAFSFAEGIREISHLKEGMELPGIVTNVTKFGAFVDIGVHQDGLVHISQLADKFISDPNQIVKVEQKVNVTVTEIDINRKRIALSMKKNNTFSESSKDKKKVVVQKKETSLNDKLELLKSKFKK